MRLIDAISRIIFGNNTIDNATDWHQAHTKAQASREELQRAIEEAKLLEKVKAHTNDQIRKDNS